MAGSISRIFRRNVSPSELTLIPISQDGNTETVVDVIFIHGLGGDPIDTWQTSATSNWPSWIAQDIPAAKVWTLGYPAGVFSWLSTGKGMAIQDRSSSILDYIVGRGIGERPIVFVCHSLGGLVFKQMLQDAATLGQASWKRIAGNTSGVVFLGTPHTGSTVASVATALGARGVSVHIRQLTDNDPHLRALCNWYSQNANKLEIRTKAYCETAPVGPLLVVDAASANPNVEGCEVVQTDGDHFAICKPRTRMSPVHVGVRRFIEEVIALPKSSSGLVEHVLVGAGFCRVLKLTTAATEPASGWRRVPENPDEVFKLLSWRSRLCDELIGREAELADLINWACSGPNVRIRVLSGPGGAGKSRLAAEIADRLRGTGWTAGFLDLRQSAVVPLRKSGLLLIADYPEEHRENLLKTVAGLATFELAQSPIRLLLLSRQPTRWWESDVDSVGGGDFLDCQEIGLDALSAADAERVFNRVVARLSSHLKMAAPQVPRSGIRDWIALNPTVHGRSLFVTAAAVESVLTQSTMTGINSNQVIASLARRERRRLDGAGNKAGLNEHVGSRLAALATLVGQVDAGKLKVLADPELEIGLPAVELVVDAVRKSPCWEINSIPALEPDIIAVALMYDVFLARDDLAPLWIGRALLWESSDTINRLGRILVDLETLEAAAARRFIEWLDQFSEIRPECRAGLAYLASSDLLPRGLSKFAAKLSRHFANCATNLAQRAIWLNNLSNHLILIGDPKNAIMVMREAVDLHRRLAAENAPRFTADLAASLNNLSNCEFELGDNVGALLSVHQAVLIRRALAKKEPALFGPDLAESLSNLAIYLDRAGDSYAALKSSREAVAMFRVVAAARPRRFEPKLATCLCTHSANLGKIGELQEAIKTVEEAVELQRRYFQENPSRFGLEFAASLHNLSKVLGDSGDFSRALVSIGEAINIQRRAVYEIPTRQKFDLARSLVQLSSCLRAKDDFIGALAATQEAVDLWRELSRSNAQLVAVDLANSLGDLSNLLNKTGDSSRSLVAILESVAIFRSINTKDSRKLGEDFVRCLFNLSNRLSERGDEVGALSAIHEAVALAREGAADNYSANKSD